MSTDLSKATPRFEVRPVGGDIKFCIWHPVKGTVALSHDDNEQELSEIVEAVNAYDRLRQIEKAAVGLAQRLQEPRFRSMVKTVAQAREVLKLAGKE